MKLVMAKPSTDIGFELTSYCAARDGRSTAPYSGLDFGVSGRKFNFGVNPSSVRPEREFAETCIFKMKVHTKMFMKTKGREKSLEGTSQDVYEKTATYDFCPRCYSKQIWLWNPSPTTQV